jgi:hypothetical protein
MTRVLYIYEKIDKSFSLIKKLNNENCQLETLNFTHKTFFDKEVINSFDLLIIDIEFNLVSLFMSEIERFLTPSIFLFNRYNEKMIKQLVLINILNIKIKPVNLDDLKSSPETIKSKNEFNFFALRNLSIKFF